MQKSGAVTVRDVATMAGVSLSTVSNVLNRPDRVASATRARVTDAIEHLGYIRNDAARALRLGESRAVGLVISESTSPFYAEIIRSAATVLADRGYSALVGSAYQDAASAERLVQLFEAQRVDGLLLNPFTATPGFRTAIRRGAPTVYVDADAPDSAHCSVTADHVAGGRMAVQHLAAVGRRRIALVRGPVHLSQIAGRLEGARAACAELGLSCEELVASTYFVRGGMNAGEVIASRPVSKRPDAIFAANDILAMGIITSLAERGIRVPDDVAVIGYDDTDFALAARVPLTTLRQPATEIGARAAALLLEEIEGDPGHQHEATVLLPELIVRGSTLP
ncbi:MAG TPA: LacI family DNA-binding transcriptional regulator [Arachnia sp.]|jgi:LacI family transcriptional regulator|nr:LacI family DNA-binding transcriptional regulator [Arachnia sp.]